MNHQYLAFIAMAGWLVLLQLNQRFNTPVLAIFLRWYRWLTFSALAGLACRELALIDRPIWVLYAVFFWRGC